MTSHNRKRKEKKQQKQTHSGFKYTGSGQHQNSAIEEIISNLGSK